MAETWPGDSPLVSPKHFSARHSVRSVTSVRLSSTTTPYALSCIARGFAPCAHWALLGFLVCDAGGILPLTAMVTSAPAFRWRIGCRSAMSRTCSTDPLVFNPVFNGPE